MQSGPVDKSDCTAAVRVLWDLIQPDSHYQLELLEVKEPNQCSFRISLPDRSRTGVVDLKLCNLTRNPRRAMTRTVDNILRDMLERLQNEDA